MQKTAIRPEWFVLSGWLRKTEGLDPAKTFNIHPALLPSFPGCHAVRDALKGGVKITGVTVHFVDEKMDHGPILLQEAVPVKEGDTVSSLHERIHRVEHRLYPKAIQRVLNGKAKLK